MAALAGLVQSALQHDRAVPNGGSAPFEIRTHARNNPAANTSFDIVPGLIGTILTMTMLIFTALSVTRELERGTMESLLSMPIAPVEIMLGRVSPYIIVGLVQAALILGLGIGLFGVPLLGSLGVLGLLSTSFITANLSIDYTFSTIAQNQVQAMQKSMMFFLPNILLSGFMFPFAGMPNWAQWIGELLPLTHYLRIVRAIMLKGASLPEGACRCPALAGLTLVAMSIAITRFGRTLD
jgi:ABC-2 type transport system permease protein